MSSRQLSKKILCSILTAGVLSIGGVQCVWAEEYGLDRVNPVENADNKFAAIDANDNTVSDNNISIVIEGAGDEKIISGIHADQKDLEIKSSKIEISGEAKGATQLRFLRSIKEGNIVVNGDIVGDLSSDSGLLRFVDVWDSNITINGNTDITLSSSSGTVSGIGGGEDNLGIGSNITFNGDNKFDFSGTGRIVGIENYDNNGCKIVFNGDIDLKTKTVSGLNQAVYLYVGTTEFNSKTDVYAENIEGNTAAAGWLQSDRGLDHPTILRFNGEETNLTAVSAESARGLMISGELSCVELNSNKTTIISKSSIEENSGTNHAIHVQYGGNVISKAGTELNLTAQSEGNEASGLYLIPDRKFNSNANLLSDVNITASSNVNAYGIENYTTEDIAENTESYGKAYIGGDTVMNIVSNSKDAFGIYVDGSYSVVELAGNVDIKTSGKESSIALSANNGGTITVGSEGKTVSLVGDVVADGENSVINIAGDAVFNGQDTEFTSTNNGTINLAGGNMSGQLYIQSGVVNLNGATFTTNDITSDITGDGKLVLKDSGVLSTTADQIFTSESGNVTATDEVNGINNADKVTFESGTVSLTDAEYTLDFVNSAIDVMGKHEYESDKTSNTGIVMTGNLVGDLGENQITVDNAGALGNNAALDKVTVETEGNLLVGTIVNTGSGTTTVEGIKIEDSVVNGFNVGSLNLDEGSTGMVITNDKNVTLGGSEGGGIITVNGAEPTGDGVKVVVGLDSGTNVDGVTNNKGSFTIGNALATSATEYTLNGSVTVNNGSNLTTNGQTDITGGVTLNGGNLDAASGVLKTDVAVKENTTNTITGTVNAGKLTAGSEADTLGSSVNTTVINIGNSDKAANVVVTEAALNGATVFLDPAWKDDITDASKMAVKDTAVDGKYAVGQNSVLSFGIDNTEKAQEVFAKTGLTWGEKDITAALYLADSVDLTNGAIVVDGTLTAAPTINTNGTFTAEKGSVTMIDGSKFAEKDGGSVSAAITGVTTATIDDGAKLFIDNAKKGETYNVISGTGVGTAADDRWSTDNIDFDNTLLVVDTENTKVENNTFVVGAKYQKVDDAYGKGAVVIADIIDKTLEVGKDGDAAYDFFNAAASENGSEAGAVAAFNSAANMGEMGGVNHAAYSVSNAMTDAVADHLSITTHGDQDKDIWANYVHNKENIEGISLGGINVDYDLQYNGIVVGSDLYKNGKATAGIALSYVEGDVTNSNIASNTKNEAEYYGASVYGRIDNGNSAVLGDITYMHGSSDITQQNSGHKLTADADTDVFSIGVRAEQKVEAGIGHFVPYAGLRYMHIGTGNYTNSIGMSYDVDEQNLWLLPVGVTYSCEAQKGDWTIRPVVEAGYVWAMGDRDTNQTVSLNGAADGFGFDTADSGSFISRFAVEAEKANVIYSLGYEYQKGDTVKANKWMANMTFTF